MKFILEYLLKYKKLLILDFIMVFGFVIVEIGLPTLLAKIINVGIPKANYEVIHHQLLLMLGIVLLSLAMMIFLNYLVAKLSTLIVRDIRNDIFAHIQSFSHLEYEQIGVSTLITRMTNDPFQIYLFVSQILRVGFITPVMFAMSIVMIMRTAPTLSIYVWVALPLMILTMTLLAKVTEPLSESQQHNLDKINEIMRENLSGFRVIRAFVRETFFAKRFETVNLAYKNSSKRLFKFLAAADPGFSFLFNIVMGLVIFSGAVQIAAGDLQLGNLLAFFDYIFHMLFSFMLLAMVFTMFPRANVSGKRIQEVLSIQTTIDENENGRTIDSISSIEFKEVSFSYHDEERLHLDSLSFTATQGETIAFVGGTGSGKSTAVQLLPRFFDATKGEVLVNGYSVREYSLKSLRKQMGYIPQKAQLYTGSIRENLKYGNRSASDEELLLAAEISDAKNFILEKENGLDTLISEGGGNFSGGQKQRLAITRAIVRKPSLYVFDDSFSALDATTDALVRRNLRRITKDAITIIVAQRLSTIMDADKILVLNQGKLEAMGTHEELLQTSPTYRELAESQLTKEELDDE